MVAAADTATVAAVRRLSIDNQRWSVFPSTLVRTRPTWANARPSTLRGRGRYRTPPDSGTWIPPSARIRRTSSGVVARGSWIETWADNPENTGTPTSVTSRGCDPPATRATWVATVRSRLV